jgi:hypothetical protein
MGLKLWPWLKNTSWLEDILENEIAVRYWASLFDFAFEHDGNVSYWDHQWAFACWAHSGLSIMPKHNLVSNVGCGRDATHTFNENDPTLNLPTEEMKFPLVHPPAVLQNREVDRKLLREALPYLPKPATPLFRLRRLASRAAPEILKRAYHAMASACA